MRTLHFMPCLMAAASGLSVLAQVAAAQPAPVLQAAASRMVHGLATFDLPLSLDPSNPTTEPRQGAARTILLTFDKPISAATALVTEGTATAAAPTFSGNDVLVGLTGVANQQYVTVSLSNVAPTDGGTGGSGSVRIGFLIGDVSQNRVVTVADLGLVNAQLAQVVTAANFLKDVNATGTLTVADKGITNSKLTNALPVLFCDAGLPSNSSDAMQYAAAMELCQTATEVGTTPGVISAALTLSSGANAPAAASRSIRGVFGVSNMPSMGASMVVLSTGAAAATGQTNPNFASFQPGLDTGTSSTPPADWLAAHGGTVPVLAGCPAAGSSTAFNPVMLTLRIRVPDNANSSPPTIRSSCAARSTTFLSHCWIPPMPEFPRTPRTRISPPTPRQARSRIRWE